MSDDGKPPEEQLASDQVLMVSEYVDMERRSLRSKRRNNNINNTANNTNESEQAKSGPSSGGLRITLPLPALPSVPSTCCSEGFPLMQLPDTVMDQLLGK